ncbi:cytochrome ubiquinol oxidase subunit I, partial [Streptococcus pneumoniae]|uniref:cytochrome ubiquinol oxidase subunit I n=1 Tax=Streptococcus pneumoniae TaxID=1313 RepID=UPI001CB78433
VHIIFATIGVGMPLMFAIAEFLGIKKKDPKYIALAKRWSKGYTITVAVGVVTGTIIRSYYFCYYWSRNAINVCNRRVFRDQKERS